MQSEAEGHCGQASRVRKKYLYRLEVMLRLCGSQMSRANLFDDQLMINRQKGRCIEAGIYEGHTNKSTGYKLAQRLLFH